jgi:hypothetical protein
VTYDPDEVSRALGRVEGKIDMLVAAQESAADKCGQCNTRFEMIESQVHTHKTFFWGLGAALTLIGGERLLTFFHFPK